MKGIIIRQSDGHFDTVEVDTKDNASIVKKLNGIRVNGMHLPELIDYGYNVTIWYNTIRRKTDGHNIKASRIVTKKVYGDALITDQSRDLDVSDYNKILDYLITDAKIKQEALKQAKADYLAEKELEKVQQSSV